MRSNMGIYGHRGFSGCYPENTMIAFEEAESIGVDGIELDVQMTKDGELVVIHDEKVDRTTNGTGYVKDLSYEQIRLLDAGSWFDPKFSNQIIPSLSEVLEWVKGLDRKLTVNIELKTDRFDYTNIEKNVLSKVYEYQLNDQVIISSFNQNSLKRVREIDPYIQTALLFIGVPSNVLEDARTLRVNGIHCEPQFASSIEGQKMRENGYPIRVYTVNDQSYVNALKKAKASIIMTDFPNRFLSL
ncbi:glycerophosphodiester phosphodiesterase [Bacillus sp. FJAT-29790]|uniref:glycerophosphodiester phosphodiesterase n=1 Tax=Bacillus sp. FJAT-29790 TaxID=1895002 RepID=UPI0020B2E309|nr:glycerophosphodiester phosphodiesterase [Bacillus sp. FJAT-29790]